MKIPFIGAIKRGVSRAKSKRATIRTDVDRVTRQENYRKMLNEKTKVRRRGSYGK